MDEGESRGATSSLFVWDEPPSLAHVPLTHILLFFMTSDVTLVSLPSSCFMSLQCFYAFWWSPLVARGGEGRRQHYWGSSRTPYPQDPMAYAFLGAWLPLGALMETGTKKRATHFKENFLTPSFSCLSKVCDFKLQPRCLKLFLRLLSYQETRTQKEWIRLFLIF